MRLNQVTVPVSDVARSVEFYTRLGLIQIVGGESYARFRCPDGDSTFSVHLAEPAREPGGTVVCFECDDLDAVYNALDDGGVAFTSPPTDMRWLWREARLFDPDGHEICLFSAGDNRLNPPWRLPATD